MPNWLTEATESPPPNNEKVELSEPDSKFNGLKRIDKSAIKFGDKQLNNHSV